MPSKRNSTDTSYFSDICIEQCKGRCCNPWWGIISFHINKNGGLSSLSNFKKDLISQIERRKERIKEQYITSENPPRKLFSNPIKQHVSVENIEIKNTTISLTLRAMFAFRCNFLSEDNVCLVHPSITGSEDVRPPHCGYMGSLNATPNEKGYCRIIHTAEISPGDDDAVTEAINVEKNVSDKFFNEGVDSTDEAADKIIDFVSDYCRTNAVHLLELKTKAETPGRNDPCYCGSGKKYKKCHGR